MSAAAVFATFSSRAGEKIAVPYQQAVDRTKDVTDPDDLNENQARDKLFLEKHRTQHCALCRYGRNAHKQERQAELKACLRRFKDECIGKTCPICDEEFVEGDQDRVEFDHRDQDTKSFNLSDLNIAESLGGVTAMELERAKCDIVHESCHRQRTFLQLHGLDGRMSQISDRTLDLIAARLRPLRALKMRRKLDIGICACGCKKKVTKRNYMCFDFAHTPGEGDVQKVKGVSHIQKIGEIEPEIKKCRLLFCECHKRQETDPGRVTWEKIRGF